MRFQLREYTETTRLIVELILVAIGFIVISPADSPRESTVLVLFAAYIFSLVCCFRLLPRFGGSTRDLFALALGRGKFELSQVGSALALALAGSMTLGLSIVVTGSTEALLLPKIVLQCMMACALCSATIFSMPTLTTSPVVPIVYGLAGFIYPVLGDQYHWLGFLFASGDGFFLSKAVLILACAAFIFKRSHTRDYISE